MSVRPTFDCTGWTVVKNIAKYNQNNIANYLWVRYWVDHGDKMKDSILSSEISLSYVPYENDGNQSSIPASTSKRWQKICVSFSEKLNYPKEKYCRFLNLGFSNKKFSQSLISLQWNLPVDKVNKLYSCIYIS